MLSEEEELELLELEEEEALAASSPDTPAPSLGKKLLKAVIPSSDAPPVDVAKPFSFYPGAPASMQNERRKSGMGVQAGKAALDVLGTATRATGAAFDLAQSKNRKGMSLKQVGDSFLEKMGDPDEGWLQGAREAVANSDKSAAVKLLQTFGLAMAEDPLALVSAISVANKVRAANAAVRAGATKTIKAGEKLKIESALPGKAAQAGDDVTGVPLSRTQQADLGADPLPPNFDKIAKTETEIKFRQKKVWAAFREEQDEAFQGQVANTREQLKFVDVDPELAATGVVGTTIKNLRANKVKMSAKYKEVEDLAAQVDGPANEMLEHAKKTMDESGIYATKRDYDAGGKLVPDFNRARAVDKTVQVDELVPGPTKLPSGVAGTLVENPTGNVWAKKSVNTVELITEELANKRGISSAGVSDIAVNAIAGARRTIDQIKLPYSELKKARSGIGHHIGEIDKGIEGYGPADRAKFSMAYDQLTNAMEGHHMAVGKAAGLDEAATAAAWRTADEMRVNQTKLEFVHKRLLNRPEFRRMKTGDDPTFMQETALAKLTRSHDPENFKALQYIDELEQLGVVDAGAKDQLGNALWNDLINRSTDNGLVNPKKFRDNARAVPAAYFDLLFSGDKGPQVANLVQQGMAMELSKKIRVLEVNPHRASNVFADVASHLGLWALMKGGVFGLGKWHAAKWVTKTLLTRGDLSAARFIREYDQKSLYMGLFKGGAAGAATSAAIRTDVPLDAEPTPEAGIPDPASPEPGPTLE